ncbi:MAG TPA: sugar phosphate isomerase/epimerase [Candidatus Saccharicenans sp.]|nr:sugar phosphate isomerase/epimerase [Candidatus Saccharicenans sp.]HOP61018.1 sugar phosphate isomerase/epimerase [Candidatus Saccharicenans sp.]HPU93874.1 sugar phosphate isomerase/epimerase [Candidatus Saccharicenans sp.]HQM74894.1 sugar phosphate isomerase/epimerase [Candidatus Saccharicenans sp.]
MARPITLFTGQWADLPFEVVGEKASSWGYDGLEIATWGDHLEVKKAAEDPGYLARKKEILAKYRLECRALGAHLAGQCVGDLYDSRLDDFAPAEVKGKPDEIRRWAIEEMKLTARAAKNLGCYVVNGFMGSPIWKFWYSFPATSEELVEKGFRQIKELWTPIFDEFDRCGVKFALEVHPTEIAFDFYTANRLLEVFDYRPTLGFNFDPSHLLWQGMTPHLFIREFPDRIFHVHLKDVALTLDGKASVLGSHLPFGDLRRGWNFRSLGHGDVDFESIIRELNAIGYEGPLSVEWEDNGMDREFGAKEALEFVRGLDFKPSEVAFDSHMKK